MKQIVFLMSVVCLVEFVGAQNLSLCVATDKTTSLIFPYAIRHVDRGSKDVLVQPVSETDNILLVKAAAKDFPETNLSVVTEDGNVYCFAVCYGNPSVWVHKIPGQSDAAIATYANRILDNPGTLKGIKDEKWEMATQVIGIYIRGNVLYYQLQLTNESSIDYDIDLLRFYIRDKKKGKRTAAQEIELKPLHIAGNISSVRAKGQTIVVVALDKFTIPDAKYFVVQLMEKNGGRHLQMRINNRNIIHAIPLPDLR